MMPLSLSAFWIRPMAISLPGMSLDEKMTVSPSTSLSSCWPKAIRPSAARGLALAAGGDDHHLLARQAHRLVEAIGSGKSSR